MGSFLSHTWQPPKCPISNFLKQPENNQMNTKTYSIEKNKELSPCFAFVFVGLFFLFCFVCNTITDSLTYFLPVLWRHN